jgi:hypothetical protein
MVGMASKEHLRGLEEIAVNIVKNTVPLTKEEERICQRWKKTVTSFGIKEVPKQKEEGDFTARRIFRCNITSSGYCSWFDNKWMSIALSHENKWPR